MSFPTTIERVIIVPFENHSYNQVIASGPYFKILAQTYGRPTNNKESCNPSLPCYLALSCGSTKGKCGTDSMSGLPINVNNVFRLVQSAGLTYGNWAESSNANRHIPATFYTDSIASLKNFSDFQTKYISGNLIPPNLCIVTPSLCHDAHDCSVSVADTWLKNTFNLPTLLQKSWAQKTCFIIWWDEGYGSPKYVVFVSPVSMGTTNTSASSDYETLTTIEWLLGLGTCGNNDNPATHPPMKNLFQTIGPQILASVTVTPGTVTVNVGVSTQLGATCKDSNNATMTCPALTWISSDTSKVAVDSIGKVTGIAAGSANVIAKSGTTISNTSAITVSTSPSGITVTTPSIGLIYKVGESRVVRWTHISNTDANVKIELLKAGVLVKTVSLSTPNDDTFAWTIPSVAAGNDYQVRVTSTTNAQNTGTSGNFTIQ